MIKYYCDCCLEEGKLNSFTYRCHIDDMLAHNVRSYVDNDMNPVSSRMIEKNFCNKCYNIIVSKAVQEYHNRIAKQ